MSARRDVFKRKLTQGRVRDFTIGTDLRDGNPLTISGVVYAQAADGDLVRLPTPRGLIWTGARFEEKEIE